MVNVQPAKNVDVPFKAPTKVNLCINISSSSWWCLYMFVIESNYFLS